MKLDYSRGTSWTDSYTPLTFPPGYSTLEVVITALRDVYYEGDETVTCTLQDMNTGATSAATLLILDINSPPDGLPVVSVERVSDAAEGGAAGAFRFSRTSANRYYPELMVFYTILTNGPGYATPYSDYYGWNGNVTIPFGQPYIDVPLVPIDDGIIEQDEEVAIHLLGRSYYASAWPRTASIFIYDNDISPLAAVSLTVTTPSETPVTINALDTSYHSGGRPITVTSAGGAANGTLVLLTGGNIRYSPGYGFHGGDSFTYTVADDQGRTATGTVSVTVDNGYIVAPDLVAATTAGRPISVNVTAAAYDPDGDPLSLASCSPVLPGAGQVTYTPAGIVTYTPAVGYVGVTTFSYLVTDGRGDQALGSISVTVSAGTGSGAISGVVWVDRSLNARLDSGEVLVTGATVGLYALGQSVPVATATTTAAGAYQLPTGSLAEGAYRLRFTDPPGRPFVPQGGDSAADANGWTAPIALVPNSTLTVSAAVMAAPAPTPFSTQLRNNFANWDKAVGVKGKLTLNEIDDAMTWSGGGQDNRPVEVKGDAAAALANMKAYFVPLSKLIGAQRGLGLNLVFKDGITVKEIEAYEWAYAVDPANLPAGVKPEAYKLIREIEDQFQARVTRLAEARKSAAVVTGKPPAAKGPDFERYILTKASVPDASKVYQGYAGDCVLLATLIGSIRTNGQGQPNDIEIIKNIDPQNAKWDYRVRFGSTKLDGAIAVTKPTEAQIALYANAGDNGRWLSILEKAYAILRLDKEKERWEIFPSRYFQAAAYQKLQAEYLEQAMKIVTGKDPAVNLNTGALDEDDVKLRLERVVDYTQMGPIRPLRVIVTAISKLNPAFDADDQNVIPPAHAFTITGYDVAAKVVRLENPWHATTAYPKYGGVFTLSVKDFCTFYGALCVERRPGVN